LSIIFSGFAGGPERLVEAGNVSTVNVEIDRWLREEAAFMSGTETTSSTAEPTLGR